MKGDNLQPARFDLYVRTIASALLSIGIVSAAIVESLVRNVNHGPVFDWGGIIVGVYFGAHVATNGRALKQRATDPEGSS